MKKPTVSKLKKKLDKIFSLWIRTRDNFTCFTCGKKGNANSIQNGHYVGRANNSLRYSEINCNAQCVGCNIFKHGALDEYALKLQMKYGDGILKELNQEKQKTKQWTISELQELIKKYESL